jgi:hypothetical protein
MNRFWKVIFGVCLASGVVSTGAAAQWGSIHGNNRSMGGEHAAAPRPVQPRVEARPAERGRVEQARPAERGRVEQARPAEQRRGEIPPRIAPRAEEYRSRPVEWARDRRLLDIDREHSHAFFWSGIHAGLFLGGLPTGYVPVYVSGNPYYYYEGVYYEPSQSGYVVVTPPIGAIVPELPPGAEAVSSGPNVYYYAAGAFYLQEPQGFVVVAPPLGVTINSLPPDALSANVNGRLYYQADGAYFMPVMQNGVTAYVTVQP